MITSLSILLVILMLFGPSFLVAWWASHRSAGLSLSAGEKRLAIEMCFLPGVGWFLSPTYLKCKQYNISPALWCWGFVVSCVFLFPVLMLCWVLAWANEINYAKKGIDENAKADPSPD